jgi:hypothetical protein
MNRRDVFPLLAAGLAGAPAGALGAEPDVTKHAGFRVPRLELVYECDATLSDMLRFGEVNDGTRNVIPITGGTFRGPRISGTVVPGGADWNLARNDGATMVDASYYLRTDDGVLLRITNRGVGQPQPQDAGSAERFYMFTIPTFEAPKGKYAWLNSSVFVGTLGARRDAQKAVLIRVFQLV